MYVYVCVNIYIYIYVKIESNDVHTHTHTHTQYYTQPIPPNHTHIPMDIMVRVRPQHHVSTVRMANLAAAHTHQEAECVSGALSQTIHMPRYEVGGRVRG